MLQNLCSFCFLLLTTDACAFPNLLRRVADHDADINRKRTFGGGGQLYCNFNNTRVRSFILTGAPLRYKTRNAKTRRLCA